MNTLWTIYNRPSAFPDHIVVRECVGGERGRLRFATECTLFASLEDARESLWTRGLICIPRQPGDDPALVENWL